MQLFLLLCLVKISSGLSQESHEFVIKYFQAKRVKTVCLLSCGNPCGDLNFIKQAFAHSLLVTRHVIKNGTHVQDINVCFRKAYSLTGVILDATCDYYEDVLLLASEKKMLNSKNFWLIFQEDETNLNDSFGISYDLRDDIFKRLNLSVDAEITIASRNDGGYELREVFNFGTIQNGHYKTDIFGNWSKYTGISLTSTYKYTRRFDLEGLRLRLMIVFGGKPQDFKPELILQRKTQPGVSIFSQTSGMVLYEVAALHNINFNYSITDRWAGEYSRDFPVSTASALYFGDIDIAPVLRYTTQHAGYYDVIHPHVTYAAGGYFYRIPTTGVGKFENQFLTPFTGTVWLCVVVVIALCGVGLVLGASFEDRPQAGRYAFFSVVALTCQQFFEDVDESAVKRNSTARKLTILVTGLSCVLIFNYYTSSVVSWLLNGPPPSINSLWELMNSPLEPIFMDVGYTWSWLQSPNYYFNVRDAKAEDVLKKKVKKKGPHLVSTPTQGIELVHKGGYVLYCDTDTANKYIALTFSARELCDVGRLPGLEKIPMYSCVQKNSPYREFFIWSFARMAEQGIIKLIQTRTYPPEIRCEGSTPRALALGGAAPAFIILAFGYIMGTLFMVMERIIKVHKDKKMMKVKYFE